MFWHYNSINRELSRVYIKLGIELPSDKQEALIQEMSQAMIDNFTPSQSSGEDNMDILECPECGTETAWIDKENPKVLHCNICASEFTIESKIDSTPTKPINFQEIDRGFNEDKIYKIICEYGGMNTPNPKQDSMLCAKAIFMEYWRNK